MKWTQKQIEYLKKQFLPNGAKVVASELKRSIRSVRKKAYNLGIRRKEYNKLINYEIKKCLICNKKFTSLKQKNRKYCSVDCKNEGHKKPYEDLSCQDIIKKRLITERGYKCELCGYNIIIVVHHKDLDNSNNKKGNLQLLCPNHHYEIHYKNNQGAVGKLGTPLR